MIDFLWISAFGLYVPAIILLVAKIFQRRRRHPKRAALNTINVIAEGGGVILNLLTFPHISDFPSHPPLRLARLVGVTYFQDMSAAEILAELPNLPQEELLRIQARIEELSHQKTEESVWKVLQESAGAAKDLPSDLAANHDHYLYGTRKRSS